MGGVEREVFIMSQAKKGSKVKIHYTGKLEDGTVFDSSVEREPLAFVLGEGKIIPGFETAVDGMAVGEKKTITIQPEDAYGPRHEQMVLKAKKDQLPPEITPKVGMQLQMKGPEGQANVVTITEVADDTVTLDANHPLAGKVLVFDLELVAVE